MNRKPRVPTVLGSSQWTWHCRECRANGNHLSGPAARDASLDMTLHGEGCERSGVAFDLIPGRSDVQGVRGRRKAKAA